MSDPKNELAREELADAVLTDMLKEAGMYDDYHQRILNERALTRSIKYLLKEEKT